MSEIYHNAMGMAFGVLQTFMIAAIAGAFKTYCDVRKHNRDLKMAFQKIRDLEKKIADWGDDDNGE